MTETSQAETTDVVERVKQMTGYSDEQVGETFPYLVPYLQRQPERVWRLALDLEGGS